MDKAAPSPVFWSCSWVSGGDGSGGSSSQGVGQNGGYGRSDDESRSHRLPANVIQEKASGEGCGGGRVRTAVTITAKAVTAVMVVAVAGRSRTGGNGVKRHGRRRLGRPTAARGAGERFGERGRAVCVTNTLFVYIHKILLRHEHALRLHFLPSPLWATFLRQDAGNVWGCPSLGLDVR